MDRYILIIAGVAIVTAVTLIAAFGSTLSSGTFDAKTAFVSLITADNLDEAEKTYFDERRPFFTHGNEIFMPSGRENNSGFYRPL